MWDHLVAELLKVAPPLEKGYLRPGFRMRQLHIYDEELQVPRDTPISTEGRLYRDGPPLCLAADQIGHSFSSFESPKVSLCELRVKLMDIGLPPVLSKFSDKATT